MPNELCVLLISQECMQGRQQAKTLFLFPKRFRLSSPFETVGDVAKAVCVAKKSGKEKNPVEFEITFQFLCAGVNLTIFFLYY